MYISVTGLKIYLDIYYMEMGNGSCMYVVSRSELLDWTVGCRNCAGSPFLYSASCVNETSECENF